MAVWILAGIGIIFYISAELITLHMPLLSNLVCNEGERVSP